MWDIFPKFKDRGSQETMAVARRNVTSVQAMCVWGGGVLWKVEADLLHAS